ncbi:hypothetical protein [Homoserinimonas hongtaonis]|uniref:Uncharacterized protein n=1 Tax=Homoserinimonas hongtaonis TaxID=2079791 RepID=A0A2U1T2Z7_9MICO|nr:hypothetical protein [Salinibacterium hongtaonis]PWB98252.1 hypothetical protein DF220_10750 [Salinibacterium hongtaonis]
MSTPDFGQQGSQPDQLSEAEWRATLPSIGEPPRSFIAQGHAALPAATPAFSPAATAAPSFASPTPAPSTFGAMPRTPSAAQGMYRGWTPPPSSAHTAAVWWVIFLPLIASAVQVGVLFAMFPFGPTGLAGDFFGPGSTRSLSEFSMLTLQWSAVSFAISLATISSTVWLAYRDRASLLAMGHARSASPWWLLLHTLVYLSVRRHHVRPHRGSASPIVVYVLAYGAPVVLSFITLVFLAAAVSTPR